MLEIIINTPYASPQVRDQLRGRVRAALASRPAQVTVNLSDVDDLRLVSEPGAITHQVLAELNQTIANIVNEVRNEQALVKSDAV